MAVYVSAAPAVFLILNPLELPEIRLAVVSSESITPIIVLLFGGTPAGKLRLRLTEVALVTAGNKTNP